jgi:hypothetical protein
MALKALSQLGTRLHIRDWNPRTPTQDNHMKRTSEFSNPLKSIQNSNPSSSPQSTQTTITSRVRPTVSTQSSVSTDTEMSGRFFPFTSSGTVQNDATPFQQPLPMHEVIEDGWSGNNDEHQIETLEPGARPMSYGEPVLPGRTTLAAPAHNAGTTTKPKLLPTPESGKETEEKQDVTSGMHFGDGYEENDFNLKYTALLAAAGDGDVAAQYEVALMYASGMVDDRGLADAETWLKRAADQGHGEAQQLLEKHFS